MSGSRRDVLKLRDVSCLFVAAIALALSTTGCLANRQRGTTPERPSGVSGVGQETPDSNSGGNSGAVTGSSGVEPKTSARKIPVAPVNPPVPTRDDLSGFGAELSDEVESRAIKTLKVRAGRGTVTIIGSPATRTIRATASVQTWAERLSEAKRIAHEIRLDFESRETENPSLIIPEPQLAGYQDYECDLTIEVPSTVRVTLENSAGDVEISGLAAGLAVRHRGGDLTVQNVQGGVEVESYGTACTMEQLSGKVTVDDAGGDLQIGFVTGEVIITDTAGKLIVHSVDGNVVARNNPGEPRFFSIEGNLTLVGISHNKAKVSDVSGSVVYPSSGN